MFWLTLWKQFANREPKDSLSRKTIKTGLNILLRLKL